MITIEEIRSAVARGWCHEKNARKVMDPDLAEAISHEIEELVCRKIVARSRDRIAALQRPAPKEWR